MSDKHKFVFYVWNCLHLGGPPPKSRITKSNTMSNATGRSVLGQPSVEKRRSAFEATKLSTSTDKADEDLESEFMHRYDVLYSTQSLFQFGQIIYCWPSYLVMMK